MTRGAWLVLIAVLAAACAAPGRPLAGTEAADASPAPVAGATPTLASSPSTAPTATASTRLDLDGIRQALLGPSPVPSGWAVMVDGVVETLKRALEDVPAVDGLPDDEAACATWRPLVGRLHWVDGVVVERQVALAHLAQLAAVAPVAIRPAAEDAFGVAARAAAEQLAPDPDLDIVMAAPKAELRSIGKWALEHCDLEVTADSDPNTEGWTEDDFEYSCQLDRSPLEEGMEAYREGPGKGRYATHPHELEITLEGFIYPGWHRISSVDNGAGPPTFALEPIPGSHCDR